MSVSLASRTGVMRLTVRAVNWRASEGAASALDIWTAMRASRASDGVIVLCTIMLLLIELQPVARAYARRIGNVGRGIRLANTVLI